MPWESRAEHVSRRIRCVEVHQRHRESYAPKGRIGSHTLGTLEGGFGLLRETAAGLEDPKHRPDPRRLRYVPGTNLQDFDPQWNGIVFETEGPQVDVQGLVAGVDF